MKGLKVNLSFKPLSGNRGAHDWEAFERREHHADEEREYCWLWEYGVSISSAGLNNTLDVANGMYGQRKSPKYVPLSPLSYSKNGRRCVART